MVRKIQTFESEAAFFEEGRHIQPVTDWSSQVDDPQWPGRSERPSTNSVNHNHRLGRVSDSLQAAVSFELAQDILDVVPMRTLHQEVRVGFDELTVAALIPVSASDAATAHATPRARFAALSEI